MILNKRFGHFGMLVLPFGLLAFLAGIYTSLYTLTRAATFAYSKVADMYATKIPPHLTPEHLNWFYINTSTMSFLIAIIVCGTLMAVMLGQRIALNKQDITLKALFSYFALFGLIAPVWLFRAAWGAALARESKWR